MTKRKIKRRTGTSGVGNFLRGSATIAILFMVIAIGAVMMVGGIFPKFPTGPASQEETEIDESTLPNPDERENLQLETFGFKKCSNIPAVDFLVDNSGSMEFGEKMPELKKGMNTFASNFPDTGIVGLQVYSSPAERPPTGYEELVPISLFSDVKANFSKIVNSMDHVGATYSKDAMNFAAGKIEQAMARFPDRRFNLIFISDGIPETEATEMALCPNQTPASDLCSVSATPRGERDCRCFAEVQNPTAAAADLKARGVRIFTISYIDNADQKFNDRLQTLMQNVASSPDDYYQAPAETQLTKILAEISNKLCE